MRPGDFSPGNDPAPRSRRTHTSSSFNEAGGFLPRKPQHDRAADAADRLRHASMRPGDFSPGNSQGASGVGAADGASMRPGDFSPGNPGGAAPRTV